jgi:hypothetical protein
VKAGPRESEDRVTSEIALLNKVMTRGVEENGSEPGVTNTQALPIWCFYCMCRLFIFIFFPLFLSSKTFIT